MPEKKAKSKTLYYSTHNLTGLRPPVNAFIVVDPANHKTVDGKPMSEKIQEFQDRGFLKRVASNSEVGAKVDEKGRRNKNISLSEGAKSRSKK